MKKIINTIRNKAAQTGMRLYTKVAHTRMLLAGNSGEGYVDTAVKILMAVVIGALVLAGLYALFGDTVMPTLTRRIQEMFNYGGAH